MNVILILSAYLFLLNLIGFGMMGIDKRKAIKGAFRIPEATLFIISIIGGSIGSLMGMRVFRHKTRKWYFAYGMPLIILVQAALLVTVFFWAPVEFLTI